MRLKGHKFVSRLGVFASITPRLCPVKGVIGH